MEISMPPSNRIISFDQFADIHLRADAAMKRTFGHSYVTGASGRLAIDARLGPHCQWCGSAPTKAICPHWFNTFTGFLALELTGEFAIPEYQRIDLPPSEGGIT